MGEELGIGWGPLEEAQSDNTLSWLRVPAGTSLDVVILCEVPVHYEGHWLHQIGEFGRCAGVVCRHCVDRVGRQRRFVFVVQDEAGKAWAWEVGKLQAASVRAGLDVDQRLRGVQVSVLRPGGRGNPPMLLSVGGIVDDVQELPECPDVGALLKAQWQRQALRLGKGQVVRQPALFNSEKIPPTPETACDLRAHQIRRFGR